MTEILKTLKELESRKQEVYPGGMLTLNTTGSIDEGSISKKVLRQEAIKHYKHFKNIYNKIPSKYVGEVTWTRLGAKLDFIEEFFNLSEEDLK